MQALTATSQGNGAMMRCMLSPGHIPCLNVACPANRTADEWPPAILVKGRMTLRTARRLSHLAIVSIVCTSCGGGARTTKQGAAAAVRSPGAVATPAIEASACAPKACAHGLHVALSPPLVLDRPYSLEVSADGESVACVVTPHRPSDRCDAAARAAVVRCSRPGIVERELRDCDLLTAMSFLQGPEHVRVGLSLDATTIVVRELTPTYERAPPNGAGCDDGCVSAGEHLALPLQLPATSHQPGTGWVDGAEAEALLKPWAASRELPGAPDPADLGRRSARLTLNGVEVSDYNGGSGRWATFQDARVHLARGGCDAERFSLEGGKESLIHGLKLERNNRNVVALLEAVWVTEPGLDELAAARMLVQQASTAEAAVAGAEILGTALPVQPDHPGRPRGSRRAFWDQRALASASVAEPRLVNEPGAPWAGLVTAPIPPPVRLTSGGRWELWEVRFAARLGGGMLAAYDVRNDRTRWVFGTEIDDDDATPGRTRRFDLLAFEGDLVLVRTREAGHQSLWALDLARGLTRQVMARPDATFRRAAKGIIVIRTSDVERRVSLSELSP